MTVGRYPLQALLATDQARNITRMRSRNKADRSQRNTQKKTLHDTAPLFKTIGINREGPLPKLGAPKITKLAPAERQAYLISGPPNFRKT